MIHAMDTFYNIPPNKKKSLNISFCSKEETDIPPDVAVIITRTTASGLDAQPSACLRILHKMNSFLWVSLCCTTPISI